MIPLIKIRDFMRLIWAIIWGWLYIPHILIWLFSSQREIIRADLHCMREQINIALPDCLVLLFLLHHNKYYRAIFYHRIGVVAAAFISWYRPSDRYFMVSATTNIGEGIRIYHPYATVINAETIGTHFTCIQCTTIGAKDDLRPTIGNNVTLGANVTIIGNIHVGNNVTIGAGSVVVKDIPDNCIAAGNPARIIKTLPNG